MSASETLSASHRPKLGSRASRALRFQGKIPATIQSDGPHVDIALDRQQFLSARRHHVHLFDLDVDGTVESAVVRELQWDSFGEDIVHVEFRRVQRGVEIETEVHLEFIGHPKGGVLNQLVNQLMIRSLPSQIPDAIEVRVDGLDEGDSLHASDLVLPEGASLAAEPDLLVATVASAAREEDMELATDEGEEVAEAPEEAPEEAPDTDTDTE